MTNTQLLIAGIVLLGIVAVVWLGPQLKKLSLKLFKGAVSVETHKPLNSNAATMRGVTAGRDARVGIAATGTAIMEGVDAGRDAELRIEADKGTTDPKV